MFKVNIKETIADPQKTLRLFIQGAFFFFLGVGIILFATKTMPPSLEQEAYALLGLFVGGLGFVTSLTAQVFMIISRIKGPRQDK
jgi:hypothetical protein